MFQINYCFILKLRKLDLDFFFIGAVLQKLKMASMAFDEMLVALQGVTVIEKPRVSREVQIQSLLILFCDISFVADNYFGYSRSHRSHQKHKAGAWIELCSHHLSIKSCVFLQDIDLVSSTVKAIADESKETKNAVGVLTEIVTRSRDDIDDLFKIVKVLRVEIDEMKYQISELMALKLVVQVRQDFHLKNMFQK